MWCSCFLPTTTTPKWEDLHQRRWAIRNQKVEVWQSRAVSIRWIYWGLQHKRGSEHNQTKTAWVWCHLHQSNPEISTWSSWALLGKEWGHGTMRTFPGSLARHLVLLSQCPLMSDSAFGPTPLLEGIIWALSPPGSLIQEGCLHHPACALRLIFLLSSVNLLPLLTLLIS